MTTEERKQCIEWFLRKHNAWDNFLEAIDKHRFKTVHFTVEDVWEYGINSKNSEEIFHTFSWLSTKQGADYWSDLLYLWTRRVKKA